MITRVISIILCSPNILLLVLHQFGIRAKVLSWLHDSKGVLECSLSESTWITDNLFQQFNPDLYEKFHAFNSPGSSFSKPGGVDGDKWQPPLKVYHKRKGSKAQALI